MTVPQLLSHCSTVGGSEIGMLLTPLTQEVPGDIVGGIEHHSVIDVDWSITMLVKKTLILFSVGAYC